MPTIEVQEFEKWVYVYEKTNAQAVLLLILPFSDGVTKDDVSLSSSLQKYVKRALQEYKAKGFDYSDNIYYRLEGVNQEFAYLPDAD